MTDLSHSRRPIAFIHLAALTLLLASLSLGARRCERVEFKAQCEHAGELHAVGDSFMDDCNTCTCEEDGTVSCTEIACGTACGGLLGLACDEGEFCNYPPEAICGAADQTGVCSAVPDACTLEYNPVCGCDGNTYGNACDAAANMVSVVQEGECDDTGEGVCVHAGQRYAAGDSFRDDCNTCECLPDGTVACTDIACSGEPICGTRGAARCADDEYCDFPASAMCGDADAPGVCRPRPDFCTRQYDPVCGCDGNTYGNACDAASAGVSVRSQGECGSSGGGDACGGLLGLTCEPGEFCNYPPEAFCGAADQTGTCEPIPQVCTDQYDPVCGCDDNTYGNACEAAAAGVSVVQAGECDGGSGGGDCTYDGQSYAAGDSFPSSDGCNTCTCTAGGAVACTERACVDFCGGIAGFGCPTGQFCDYPPEAQCGAADQTGSCRIPPDACTLEYNPVCGCDGNTYGNACAAAAASVSVVSSGEC